MIFIPLSSRQSKGDERIMIMLNIREFTKNKYHMNKNPRTPETTRMIGRHLSILYTRRKNSPHHILHPKVANYETIKNPASDIILSSERMNEMIVHINPSPRNFLKIDTLL